jgi:hypothetical protein
VKGPFPTGGVLSSPNFRQDVMDESFAQHCPKHCSYNNPPPSEVIGVAALAHPDLVIELVAVAALPDWGCPLTIDWTVGASPPGESTSWSAPAVSSSSRVP